MLIPNQSHGVNKVLRIARGMVSLDRIFLGAFLETKFSGNNIFSLG
jgi:hypothetical protein